MSITRQLRIRLHSLMFLWVLCAVLLPLPTFAYDEQTQTTVSYDDNGKAGSGYDAVSVLARGENKNEASGDCALFTGFAQFLAAEGGTLFSRELGSAGPRATTELLDAMRAHGRTITIAGEGSEKLRYLNAIPAEANVGGPGHLDIILRENPSRAAAFEEFLHGTQDRLGIIDRLGQQGAEDHVADFMRRHSRLLGLEP